MASMDAGVLAADWLQTEVVLSDGESAVLSVTYVAGATQHSALPNMDHCICACVVE